jgi:glycosyltransferase involved in cell wall biosynthesis
MRLMVVCTTGGSGRRQFGGAEHLLVQLLPALRERGLDVVAATPDDMTGAALREAGVPWIDLGARSRVDLAYVSGLRRQLERFRPDVVCAHLLSAAMHARAALLVRGRAIPLVVTLHNSLWQYRETAGSAPAKASIQVNIALDALLRRLRPHASVAVSAYDETELRERGNVKRVTRIPNPLPRDWAAPAAPRPPNEPVRIGYMGRLEPEKGALLLADVARALPEMQFRIAGTGSVPIPPVDNLTLVGHVDPAKFLPELDCLLVPSNVESFGKSALQALSLAVPVVHSGVGGLAELTAPADGVLAYTAERTPAAIAAAVRRAVNRPELHRDRRTIAHWYTEEFAFERAVDRWIELYRSVADGRG